MTICRALWGVSIPHCPAVFREDELDSDSICSRSNHAAKYCDSRRDLSTPLLTMGNLSLEMADALQGDSQNCLRIPTLIGTQVAAVSADVFDFARICS